MIRRPARSTLNDTLCPDTTLFRSEQLKDFGGSLRGHRRNVDGEYVYYLYRVIGGYGPEQLYMGVYAPASEVDSTAFDRLMLAGWIGFGILALALLTAVVLGRSLARPVRDLPAAAQAVRTSAFRRAPPATAPASREPDRAAQPSTALLS